jgi:hypothetical protein
MLLGRGHRHPLDVVRKKNLQSELPSLSEEAKIFLTCSVCVSFCRCFCCSLRSVLDTAREDLPASFSRFVVLPTFSCDLHLSSESLATEEESCPKFFNFASPPLRLIISFGATSPLVSVLFAHAPMRGQESGARCWQDVACNCLDDICRGTDHAREKKGKRDK